MQNHPSPTGGASAPTTGSSAGGEGGEGPGEGPAATSPEPPEGCIGVGSSQVVTTLFYDNNLQVCGVQVCWKLEAVCIIGLLWT